MKHLRKFENYYTLMYDFPRPELMDQHGRPMEKKLPQTVVDIILGSAVHKTLATAVKAAGLVSTLTQGESFTIFAPTDYAFEMLPEGTVEALLEDTEKLKAILLNHAVDSAVLSEELADGDMVETLGGGMLEVSIQGDKVYIAGAEVEVADLEAGNGVVHVINTVLLPEEKETRIAGFEDFNTNEKKKYSKKKLTYKESGLKHPAKADLDNDKKISSYEKTRGGAIESAIKKTKK